MKNNKSKFSIIPPNTKLLKQNSHNEETVRLELFIAKLIHEGASFKALLMPFDLIELHPKKKYMKTKVTNITLNFVKRNPKSAEVLNQNDRAYKFLNSLGLNFYN